MSKNVLTFEQKQIEKIALQTRKRILQRYFKVQPWYKKIATLVPFNAFLMMLPLIIWGLTTIISGVVEHNLSFMLVGFLCCILASIVIFIAKQFERTEKKGNGNKQKKIAEDHIAFTLLRTMGLKVNPGGFITSTSQKINTEGNPLHFGVVGNMKFYTHIRPRSRIFIPTLPVNLDGVATSLADDTLLIGDTFNLETRTGLALLKEKAATYLKLTHEYQITPDFFGGLVLMLNAIDAETILKDKISFNEYMEYASKGIPVESMKDAMNVPASWLDQLSQPVVYSSTETRLFQMRDLEERHDRAKAKLAESLRQQKIFEQQKATIAAQIIQMRTQKLAAQELEKKKHAASPQLKTQLTEED